jgi:hypothetical protein
MRTGLLYGKQKERDHLKDQVVDVRMLNKYERNNALRLGLNSFTSEYG